ncbi:MAG: zinc-dependent metalloprotease [Thermomicrobiales bacterium]|nr:zinc-dependent metalloprotease [Thermomicrobiales bacterium]
MPETSSPRPNPSKKLVAGGVVAGAAAGVYLTNRLRRPGADNLATVVATPSAPGHSAIDWEQARSIAVNMNRGAALTATERTRLDAFYRELGEKVTPLVGSYMGLELPPGVGQPYAFDRVDWINANIDAFRHMLTAFEPLLAADAAANGASIWGSVNRRVVAAELGVLLGYLARRVLGQYDVALLGRERLDNGKLYYVEPNIQQTEANLKLPEKEFRTWLALHETTHVFQFEAIPWVRPYFNDMLERYFAFLQEDARQIGESVKNLRIFVDRIRSKDATGGSWLEAIMNEEQRDLFNQMQAMMSIIEGYSNHVMNAIGRDLLRNYDSISKKFEVRQRNRSQAEQLFARISGLDLKMEQYRQGQKFIDTIVAQRGHDTAKLVWTGPEYLPTIAEIRDPAAWLVRIDTLEH